MELQDRFGSRKVPVLSTISRGPISISNRRSHLGNVRTVVMSMRMRVMTQILDFC